MSDQQEREGTLHVFATVGARTERGGCATSGSDFRIGNLRVACVGDVVTYEGGSRAVIMDGTGIAMVFRAACVSLSGYPYYIETTSGDVYSGRIDSLGMFPRIPTDGSDQYTVYWGDEALAKQQGN